MGFKSFSREIINSLKQSWYCSSQNVLDAIDTLQNSGPNSIKEAVSKLETALQKNNTDIEAMVCLGLLYYYGQSSALDAIKIFETIINIELRTAKDKWSFVAHKQLAIVFAVEGNYENANRHFKRAIFKNKGDPDLFYKYGLFCHILGDTSSAKDLYKQAITIDPTYAADVSTTAPKIEFLKQVNNLNTYIQNSYKY